jgi:hypothetical protein
VELLLRLLLEVDTSPVLLLLLLLLLLGVELGLVGVQRRASFHAGRWRHRRRVVLLLLLQVPAVQVEVVVHGRLVGAHGGAVHVRGAVLRGAAIELHGISRTHEGHLLLELGLLHTAGRWVVGGWGVGIHIHNINIYI